MQRNLLVLATALTAVSCASVPEFEPQTVLPAPPAAWQAATDSAMADGATDWVAALGDPVLTAMIDEAFIGNPSLQQSYARYEAALAGARVAGAPLLPTLNASGEAGRTEPYRGAGTDSFSLGLSASWEVDLWGAVRDGANAGTLDAEAAEADLRASRLSIAGLVAKGWFNLIQAREQTALAERDVENRQNSLQLTERRFARGLVRSSDVRTARSALASAEATLASRRRTEASSARTLETLLGRYPAARLADQGQVPDFGPLTGLGTPEGLLERRPDVQAAERRLQAAGLRADQARKALYPSLSLSGGTGTGGADIGDIVDIDTLVSRLTASLAAPIFNGDRLRGQRDQAMANAEAQIAAYVGVVLAAWQEAEDAIYADAILDQRVDNLERAFQEAAEAEELVIREYSRGVSTIFNLLDAQTRRISAESLFISARAARAANRVDLYLAIAGDFAAAEEAAQATTTGD